MCKFGEMHKIVNHSLSNAMHTLKLLHCDFVFVVCARTDEPQLSLVRMKSGIFIQSKCADQKILLYQVLNTILDNMVTGLLPGLGHGSRQS